MLKKIARWILKDETNLLKAQYNDARENHLEAEKRNSQLQSEIKELKEANQKLIDEKRDLEGKVLIMSQFYHLDQEPTDEEKLKIRIDLRIHELEMQILKDKLDMLNRERSYYLLSPPYFMNTWSPRLY